MMRLSLMLVSLCLAGSALADDETVLLQSHLNTHQSPGAEADRELRESEPHHPRPQAALVKQIAQAQEYEKMINERDGQREQADEKEAVEVHHKIQTEMRRNHQTAEEYFASHYLKGPEDEEMRQAKEAAQRKKAKKAKRARRAARVAEKAQEEADEAAAHAHHKALVAEKAAKQAKKLAENQKITAKKTHKAQLAAETAQAEERVERAATKRDAAALEAAAAMDREKATHEFTGTIKRHVPSFADMPKASLLQRSVDEPSIPCDSGQENGGAGLSQEDCENTPPCEWAALTDKCAYPTAM